MVRRKSKPRKRFGKRKRFSKRRTFKRSYNRKFEKDITRKLTVVADVTTVIGSPGVQTFCVSWANNSVGASGNYIQFNQAREWDRFAEIHQ